MTQPPAPYNLNDVLLLLGQSTVELAYLRGRVAQLEAQLAERGLDGTAVIEPEHAPTR